MIFCIKKEKSMMGIAQNFELITMNPSSKVSLFLKFLNKKHREETRVRGTMAAVATKHSFLAANKALEKWVCFWYF